MNRIRILIRAVLLGLLALLIVKACTQSLTSSSDYHFWLGACLTPNGKNLAAAGSEAVLINTSTGATLRELNGFTDVVCFSNNEVAALPGEPQTDQSKTVWLTQEKQVPGGIPHDQRVGAVLIGAISETQFVTIRYDATTLSQPTGSESGGSSDGPNPFYRAPILRVYDTTDRISVIREMALTSSLFPGYEDLPNIEHFVKSLGLFNQRQLLVAVSGR